MSDLLDELTCDTDQYLVIAEFRERLSLSEWKAQKFDMGEMFVF
jgi:hypothetical protein